MTNQFLFAIQSQISGRGATGDDQCVCVQPFIIRLDPDKLVAGLEIGHFSIGKPGAKFFRLSVHVQNQLRSIDSIRKARIIFDERRRGKLPAGLSAFEHQRAEIGSRSVNRSR